jgi:hypothetical protein
MKIQYSQNLLIIFLIVITAACDLLKKRPKQSDFPITPVSFTDVELTDDFWAKRIAINRTVTIPFGFKKCDRFMAYRAVQNVMEKSVRLFIF